MDLARLVWRNLIKHWLRSLLTIGSLTVALFLMLTLRTFLTALEATANAAASNRLWVQSAVSLFVQMPLNYDEKIAAVDGVEFACKFQWFGGLIEDTGMFAQFAVEPNKLLDMYPEIDIVEGTREAFVGGRQAALVAQGLANKRNWKLGDRVQIQGAPYPHPDGADVPWEFDIAAIYVPRKSSIDNATLFFQWDYFRETREVGGDTVDVGAIVLKVADGANPVPIMRTIDEMFENGPLRVQTTTEAEFNAQFISMFGSVPFFINSIGTGVLLAILLACINTMLMAGREQVHDVGILKSLGFGNSSIFAVLLSQSLFLCGLGGGLGILLALGTEGSLAALTSTILPSYEVLPATILAGVMVTLAVGLVSGLWPAMRASRLNPVEALRS
ncbi:MAG: putative ABC transport system permease protein [Planctomycetota bacterium]|jgi:putative ABC transport system permease protein